MKSTGRKLILISFVLALIAAVTVFLYFQSFKSSKGIGKTITVLVAAETIPSSTLIDKKMIKEIQVPDNSIFSDYIRDSSKIIGKYAKETITKNDGFNTDKLLDKDGNELSLKIDSNHRAISISVTGDSGVSDLLKPGDYVDIIAYFAEKKEGTKVIRPDIAEIILQKIKLLAVNKQLNREDKVSDNKSAQEKILTNFLVTLSIPTSDLERLVLAESIGSIKLALRPLKDDSTTQTSETTWEELAVNSDNGVVSNNNLSNGNEKYNSYTVKLGDTLKSISLQFYGDKSKYTIIKEANNIQDEDLILTGEIIKIPILQ